MDEYDDNVGKAIYLGMLDSQSALSQIEQGVYPVAINGNISYDFLRERGNFYVQLANYELSDPLYFLETSERFNADRIIPTEENATHILIAESIYPEKSPNSAIYVGNDGTIYRMSGYTSRILNEMTKEEGRFR